MVTQVVNPSGKTYFYGIAGSAITAQPVQKNSALALGADQTNFSNVAFTKKDWGFTGSRVYPSKRTQVISARLASYESATVAASSGYAVYTDSSHGLDVGAIVYVRDTNSKVVGIQRITAEDTNTFTTDMPYVSGAGTITYASATGTIALAIAGRYVIPFVTTDINGTASTVMKSPGSDYGNHRSIKKFMTAGRNPQIVKAIQANYWNAFTATWSTAPTASNDSIGNVAGSTVTDGTADNAASVSRLVAAELVYKTGSPNPTTDEYPLPTS